MAILGSRYLSSDEKKGREWLKKAIDAKEYSAYLILGDYEQNVKKDLKAALSEYERGKDAGQIDCILRTADFYIQGKGTEKDTARGIALLTKAAEAGNPAANFRLAAQDLAGDQPNLLNGYVHLLKAASGNLLEAQNELGLLYLSGKIGSADAPAGVAWLTRAAQAGNATAQNNLGTLYERGAAGLAANLANAGQLYSLAANQGNAAATFALARIFNDGSGTKSNPVKAWAFATLAGERGSQDGTKLANQIITKFDEKQRAEAKQELADLKSGKAAAEDTKAAKKAAKTSEERPPEATKKRQ
jgi:TPR repeat protein